ncbi:MAG: phosphatase PAP2 family protein [Verrucomicrobiales bacterium]|nr:phosphatase PAP2 family protein [Verrucomicrobiales bacterium]
MLPSQDMIASILHDMEWVLPLRHDAITPVFKAFTFLGFTEFFFAALPLLYWCWNKESGNRVAMLTLLAAILTLFFKDLFQDSRPPIELAVSNLRPDSYGLPSGHTLMAIVFWGSLAVETRNRWILVIAAIMIPGITLSRLYLGVHDLEDILGGLVIGGLLLTAFLLWKRCRLNCCSETTLWVGFFLFPVILIFVWPHGEVTGKMLLVSGFYLAWMIGQRIEHRLISFRSPLRWRKLAVALLGMLILMLLAYIFRSLIFKVGVPRSFAPALGGTLIGFSSTVFVPWFLFKLKLLQRSKS